MKKSILMPVFALFLFLSLGACRKCVICTKTSEPEVRLCEKDYNSKTEYGINVDIYEARGFNCR